MELNERGWNIHVAWQTSELRGRRETAITLSPRMVPVFWKKKTDDSEVNGFDERHLDVRSFYVGLSSLMRFCQSRIRKAFKLNG